MARWWRCLVVVAGSVAAAAPVQFRFDLDSHADLQLAPSPAFAKAGGGNGNAGGNGNSGNGAGGNSGNGNSGKGSSGGNSGTGGVGGGASNGGGSASGGNSAGQGSKSGNQGGSSGPARGASGGSANVEPVRSGEAPGYFRNASNPAGRKAAGFGKELKSSKSDKIRKTDLGAPITEPLAPGRSVSAGKKGAHEIRSRQTAKGSATSGKGKIATDPVARNISEPVKGSRAAPSAQPSAAERAASTSANDRLELIGSPSKPRQAPNSIVVSGLSEQELVRLAASGLQVATQTRGLIAPRVVRLSVPAGMSIIEAERAVQRVNSKASADADTYYYTDGGEVGCVAPGCELSTLVGWKPVAADACEAPPLIGLIDTGIDLEHEALKGQSIELLNISKEPGNRSSLDHGTAIAALLIGRPGSITPGLIPRANLVAVDAFSKGDGTADRSDVVSLVSALEALADRGVKVVNLSLSGPPNKVLEAAIEAARAQGIVLVAAVGNNGAGAEPSYPAAYPGVLGVTAVDRQLNVYRRATRGPYVAFAAPGVELRMAQSKGGSAVRSGTSYAVPFVSAAMAMMLASNVEINVEELKKHLQDTTRDLGEPGKDTTFGYGLVQMANLCSAPKTTPIPLVDHVSSVAPLRHERPQAP